MKKAATSTPKCILVTNLSEPGRGTFVVGQSLLRMCNIDVLPFDIVGNLRGKGARGGLASFGQLFRLAWSNRPCTILADTKIGIILSYFIRLMLPDVKFIARTGGLISPPSWTWSKVGLKRSLFRKALRGADAVVVPGTMSKLALEKDHVFASKVHAIANGLKCIGLLGHKITDGPIHLKVVGKLESRKAPLTALEAYVELQSLLPVSLEFIGDGPLRKTAEDIARTHGSANVKFSGFQDDPWRDMESNCVLVHPAVFDGFGYVVLEAILRGIPVVAFAGVGGPEEVIHGTSGGVIVNERTPARLASAVVELFADRALLVKKMDEARTKAALLFSENEMQRKYSELVKERL